MSATEPNCGWFSLILLIVTHFNFKAWHKIRMSSECRYLNAEVNRAQAIQAI